MMQRGPHRFYEAACRCGGVEAVHLDARTAGDGVAVVTVGSGLAMATADALVRARVSVCCVCDVGRLAPARMATVIAYAAVAHPLTVVHTWHSRSSARALYEAWRQQAVVPVGDVVWRCCGVDAESLPEEMRGTFHDLLGRATCAWRATSAAGVH